MKPKIGFIFADEMEFQPFSEIALSKGGAYLSKDPCNVIRYETETAEIIAVESGIGKVNAAFAATLLSLVYRVEAVLTAGLSGAVQHLHKGDVVAGSSYIECDFDLTAFGYEPGAKPGNVRFHQPDAALLQAATAINGVQSARLGTGDFFLADPVKKQEYVKTFDIEAFDMESAAVAAVLQRLKVPFLSVRKISDDADDSATDSYRELNNLAEKALSEVLLSVVENYTKEL